MVSGVQQAIFANSPIFISRLLPAGRFAFAGDGTLTLK
jgi:hypothetical protein